MCHVEGEGSDTSLVALVHYGGARQRYGRSMCSWPMYSWMRAVMHEKRFALHGHKSTDGLNVEEEIEETTVITIDSYVYVVLSILYTIPFLSIKILNLAQPKNTMTS